jgi:hypothetical protein
MEVDTSAYTVGAILFQKDNQRCKRDVSYYSKALNPAKRNYNIWDQEFLAVIKALGNWQHLLIGTPHKIIVWTDHANLQYYRQPQKVNQHVARGINFMAEFPLELQHIAGKKNRADLLSRRPDHDDGSNNNEGVVVLLESLFVKVIETTGMDQIIAVLQQQQVTVLNKWMDEYNLRQDKAGRYHKGIALVVLEDTKLQQDLVKLNHDSPTMAHPGIDKMHRMLLKQYWWPGCYAQSLVCSECLNDSVAGTIQIGIAGCHFWNPILVTDVNM